ncbi:hypothetical protein [Flavobacterium adhaerens]|uniref:hypothetical protein n=1 Tax=Flavobacterium adhaerens TaxID=3149043 RepID=UPI0032B5A113
MYIVKINKETETWIVAICQIEEDAINYLKTLPDEIQLAATLFEIPIEYYPFILIENTQLSHDQESYFEYCDFEKLQNRLEVARKNRQVSEEHIYFKYFYIAEPYGQMVSDKNFMQYLNPTSVTNFELDEPYPIDFFHEEIKRNVRHYDIDKLDQLFEHTKTNFNSDLEKKDLALNGYDGLFWEMNYDYACGKLTDSGISFLIPMIEKMEILLGEKKWQHRSFAQHILLEQACQKESKTAKAVLKDTVEAFENYVTVHPEEKLEIHRLLSLAYRWMMPVEPKNGLLYWELAISEMKKAINFSPEKASWSSLLELMFIDLADDGKLTGEQIALQTEMQTEMQTLENQFAIEYPIAKAYQELKEFLEWNAIEYRFPTEQALYWAEKSLAYTPIEANRIDLLESAEFFHKIGLQTKRFDFLEKAVSIYQYSIEYTEDGALEVHLISNILKQIAEMHLQNGAREVANSSIEKAREIYEKNLAAIKSNKSSFIHYTEFLEFCYASGEYYIKPTIQELKKLALELEIESEGVISYPYVLLMRIALDENNEQQAIVELTKMLILFELCVDAEFESLIEELKNSNHNQVKAFLRESNLFMNEVSENYYYDPKIEWKKLRTMSSDELLQYWKNRKVAIKNRPSFEIE